MTEARGMATRWARVARGTVAAVFATGVAGVSHSVTGGSISPLGIVIALTFAVVVCIALTGRRLSAGRLAASVGVSQFAFHTVFSMIGTAGTVTVTGHHSMSIAPAITAADAAAGHSHTDALMWVGHALAAIATLAVLRHGEAAFWRLRELVLLLAVAYRAAPVTIESVRPIALPSAPIVRPFLLERSPLTYRGPPAIRFA